MQNRYSLLIPETLIPNNSDLNDYTTPGQYYVSTAANSKTIKHCPYTLSGFKLTVEKTSSDGHILQTLKAVNAKYIYYRTAADSNFNDWLTPVTNADMQKAGIQKLAFIFNDFNGDILDISIAPGIYAVKSENPGNPSNNYALLIVIKYDNNNWIFNFLIPTDLTKLYINFYNAYGSIGWGGWKHIDFTS